MSARAVCFFADALLRHNTRSHHDGTRCFALESYNTERTEGALSPKLASESLWESASVVGKGVEEILELEGAGSKFSVTDELVDTTESVEEDAIEPRVARLFSCRCAACCLMVSSERSNFRRNRRHRGRGFSDTDSSSSDFALDFRETEPPGGRACCSMMLGWCRSLCFCAFSRSYLYVGGKSMGASRKPSSAFPVRNSLRS